MTILSEGIHERVMGLCAEGDELAKARRFEEARNKYVEALNLLPEDREQWEAATWIYVAIGNARFQQGEFEKALKAFIRAVRCPSGLGNPFIHLRLGQLYFEHENHEKALDELMRAYMGAGQVIFEEDDPKYFEFLQSKVELA